MNPIILADMLFTSRENIFIIQHNSIFPEGPSAGVYRYLP